MSRNIKAPAIGGGTENGSKKLLVLGCNTLYNNGFLGNGETLDIEHGITYQVDYNHIVVCPLTHFGASKMNDAKSTEGGYYNSLMNQQILGLPTTTGNTAGTINEQLYYEFGNHLKTFKETQSSQTISSLPNKEGDANDLGAASNYAWHLIQSTLMSEVEVYGSVVWSSSGYDTGSAKTQFPAFRYNVEDLTARRNSYWLKDVVSGTRFSFSFGYGPAGIDHANNIRFIRPRFVLA